MTRPHPVSGKHAIPWCAPGRYALVLCLTYF